jgi:hypothetical protein
MFEPNEIIMDFGSLFARTIFYFEGKNELADITPFDEGAEKESDDFVTIRGAYGPRIRHWVGADHIVEMQQKNKNLEEIGGVTTMEEMSKFKKPTGIDQIGEAYKLLKNGQPATIQIYDPSVDTQKIKFWNPEAKEFQYKPSNSIPSIKAIYFWINRGLLFCAPVFQENTRTIRSDIFFIKFLTSMFLSWLDNGVVRSSFVVEKIFSDMKDSFENNYLWQLNRFFAQIDIQNEKITPRDTWMMLNSIFDFKKHLIASTSKNYLSNPDISIEKLVSECIDQFVDRVIDIDADDENVGLSNKQGKRCRYINKKFPPLFSDGCRAMAIYRLSKLGPIQFITLIYDILASVNTSAVKEALFCDFVFAVIGEIIDKFDKVNNKEYNLSDLKIINELKAKETEILKSDISVYVDRIVGEIKDRRM